MKKGGIKPQTKAPKAKQEQKGNKRDQKDKLNQ